MQGVQELLGALQNYEKQKEDGIETNFLCSLTIKVQKLIHLDVRSLVYA